MPPFLDFSQKIFILAVTFVPEGSHPFKKIPSEMEVAPQRTQKLEVGGLDWRTSPSRAPKKFGPNRLINSFPIWSFGAPLKSVLWGKWIGRKKSKIQNMKKFRKIQKIFREKSKRKAEIKNIKQKFRKRRILNKGENKFK